MQVMNDTEKIKALREWANKNDEPDFGQWAAGYLKALTEVRDIIDPPKPKWREMVDEADVPLGHGDPLSEVLFRLSEIAALKVPAKWWSHLARIIAICEAQVGDGWQADPDLGGHRVTLANLMRRLAVYEETGRELLVDWQGLGHAAAAWLCSLTGGGAA